MSQLSVILKPDIVLGILLEVPEDKIMEIQKNCKLLRKFNFETSKNKKLFYF